MPKPRGDVENMTGNFLYMQQLICVNITHTNCCIYRVVPPDDEQ